MSRSSLAMIFTEGRLRLTDRGTIEWQLSMIIPTEKGVAVAGPVNGAVPCSIPQRRRPQSLYGRLIKAGYTELAASIVVAAPKELGDTLLGNRGQSHPEWDAGMSFPTCSKRFGRAINHLDRSRREAAGLSSYE